MKYVDSIVRVALSGALALFVVSARAVDWDSCADDLDRLKRAARDASDKANEVKSAAEELENCKRYPSSEYDGCRSKASSYQSAVSDLESELSTVDSRIRSARSSCGYSLGGTGTAVRTTRQPTENPMCELYRSYKDKLPLEYLVKACMQSMSEAECKKCLNQR